MNNKDFVYTKLKVTSKTAGYTFSDSTFTVLVVLRYFTENWEEL
jgi:hypothetical protein